MLLSKQISANSHSCRLKAMLATALWFLIAIPASWAQNAEPNQSEEDERTALDISFELEQRQLSIQAIEIELGIYDPTLVEAYSGLGAFYFENGQYQDAVDLYRQALQVARISTGLKSEQQLPVIDKLITSNMALSDWQSTDDLHHLNYYIKNQLYDPADPRFADAINEIGRWKLRVLRENLMAQNYRGLSEEAGDLSRLYRDAIGKIQSRPEFNDLALLPLYYGKSQADIEIARYVAQSPYQYFTGTVSQYINRTVCQNIRDSQGNVVRNCYNVRQENPRYRQSQMDAKRMEVNRSVRAVEASISSLNTILQNNSDIPPQQREEVLAQIRELQVQFGQIARSSRRGSLF
jgi:tetratricopeptide (TPR) repeat protein